MFFEPVNADLKLIARFSVSTFPEVDTDDADASNVHWLFCMVPVPPNIRNCPNDPASLANWMVFATRLKYR